MDARSLYRSKLDLFKNNSRSINPDIVFLSETHWVDSHPFSFGSYNSFVKNRADINGAGVPILVQKYLSASFVNIPDFSHFENVCGELK